MVAKEDTIQVVNGRLLVDVALDKEGQPSSTGKTNLFFSHSAKVSGYTVGINVYKKE
jgi:glucose-6-phosphate isomerase